MEIENCVLCDIRTLGNYIAIHDLKFDKNFLNCQFFCNQCMPIFMNQVSCQNVPFVTSPEPNLALIPSKEIFAATIKEIFARKKNSFSQGVFIIETFDEIKNRNLEQMNYERKKLYNIAKKISEEDMKNEIDKKGLRKRAISPLFDVETLQIEQYRLVNSLRILMGTNEWKNFPIMPESDILGFETEQDKIHKEENIQITSLISDIQLSAEYNPISLKYITFNLISNAFLSGTRTYFSNPLLPINYFAFNRHLFRFFVSILDGLWDASSNDIFHGIIYNNLKESIAEKFYRAIVFLSAMYGTGLDKDKEMTLKYLEAIKIALETEDDNWRIDDNGPEIRRVSRSGYDTLRHSLWGLQETAMNDIRLMIIEKLDNLTQENINFSIARNCSFPKGFFCHYNENIFETFIDEYSKFLTDDDEKRYQLRNRLMCSPEMQENLKELHKLFILIANWSGLIKSYMPFQDIKRKTFGLKFPERENTFSEFIINIILKNQTKIDDIPTQSQNIMKLLYTCGEGCTDEELFSIFKNFLPVERNNVLYGPHGLTTITYSQTKNRNWSCPIQISNVSLKQVNDNY